MSNQRTPHREAFTKRLVIVEVLKPLLWRKGITDPVQKHPGATSRFFYFLQRFQLTSIKPLLWRKGVTDPVQNTFRSSEQMFHFLQYFQLASVIMALKCVFCGEKGLQTRYKKYPGSTRKCFFSYNVFISHPL